MTSRQFETDRRFGSKRREMLTATFALLAAMALPVRADELTPIESRGYHPYKPIELTSYVFDSPRPIRAWCAKIDLTSPDVQIVTTPHGDVPPEFETACATTKQFAESADVQLAVNASPFSPFRDHPGEGMDVIGLAAADGDIFSSPHAQYGALITRADGSMRILTPPVDEKTLREVDDAAGGFHVLMRRGEDVSERAAAVVAPGHAGVNPRTAAGLSEDGRTLWLIVVDGRNKGRSEGMTLTELAAFGKSLGCYDLLNLDGGGSTTLVLQDPGSKVYRIVNQPVGLKIIGTERLVANNIGVRIKPEARTK